MNNYSLFSERLLSERTRLKLSQAEAADLCGVSREMWGKYERGKSKMGTEVLSMFAAAGADVLYILTGQRATQRQAQITQNMLLVSDDEKSQQLAQESIAALGQLNARRQQPYAYLVELLNDCSDNTLDMITQLAERLRLADVQKK